MQLAGMQPGQDPTILFFYSLASIHFQFCFKYIIPRFTMLSHQMLNLAMGSNFPLVHSPAIIALTLCTHQLSNYMPRKCISANPTIHSNMLQILIHLYLTVSIGPSYMDSLKRFSKASPTQSAFPQISPQNLFLLLPTQYFFIRTLKKIEKHIHNQTSCPGKLSQTTAPVL